MYVVVMGLLEKSVPPRRGQGGPTPLELSAKGHTHTYVGSQRMGAIMLLSQVTHMDHFDRFGLDHNPVATMYL